MALKIVEFFGFPPLDPAAARYVNGLQCPFVDRPCIKPKHGSCSVITPSEEQPVICCPNRMYSDTFKIIKEIAEGVFERTCTFINIDEAKKRISGASSPLTGNEVIMFGKYTGKELPIPKPKGIRTSRSKYYYIDWVLALLGADGKIQDIVAIEVQTIDTTGNYKDQSAAFFNGIPFTRGTGPSKDFSNAGLNWENVNKRILPQIIYKGHALRLEGRCKRGMFFICPVQVFESIIERLGDKLRPYAEGPGTITFCSYGLSECTKTNMLKVTLDQKHTTTVDVIATAFTSPQNLPDQNSYSTAIEKALS